MPAGLTMTADLSGLQRLPGVIQEAVGGGLRDAAEDILTAAQILTPVDTGTLRSSGGVTDPVFAGGIAMVQIGFGGAASAYAVIVHEDLTKHHPNGQAKFLETAMLGAQPLFQRAVEGAIIRRIGRA